MKLAHAIIVFRKELTDALRDRRNVFAVLIFPVVVFPLLSVGFGEVAESSVKKLRTQKASLMLIGAEHAPGLAEKLRTHEGFEVIPYSPDYARQIGDKKLRVALEIPSDFERQVKGEAGGEALPSLRIYYYSAEPRSEAAARRLEEVLRDYRDMIVEQRVTARGLPAALLHPVEARAQNVASAEKVGGLKLAGMLPYFIILLTLTGAVNVATDLTAGEKERGTLETILSTAVGRSELVLGKFLLVLLSSLVTSALALASFSFTMQFAKSYTQEMTRGHAYSISLTAVAAVFLLVLPLAVFFAGVMLSLALFARSFKEAQGYVGPVILLSILPAAMALMPGVEFSAKLALLPVVNVSLLAREIFTGSFPWGLIGLVFGVNCVYAAAALFVAVRQFHREEVLFRA
ncbi:MAG TPA: ABC transporter permease [Candidatus Xenobia bacterium]|nr:ABC transporter permease [Candidatus Xenobia bacterium]